MSDSSLIDKVMVIREIHTISDLQINDVLDLMSELTSNIQVTAEMIIKTVESANTHFFAMMNDDGHIIGCASLCVFVSPTGRKASVEDVVVSSSYRGLKLGRKLMEYIIDFAKKEHSPIDLHLTSNPKRISANALYKAVGFKKRDTNAYAMVIK